MGSTVVGVGVGGVVGGVFQSRYGFNEFFHLRGGNPAILSIPLWVQRI
ncbi:hypothetical protein [Sulfuracidifex tepidarius]